MKNTALVILYNISTIIDPDDINVDASIEPGTYIPVVYRRPKYSNEVFFIFWPLASAAEVQHLNLIIIAMFLYV